MDVAYAAGSLVTARGREWVVLPDSDLDLLVLRPLGGTDDDIAAVFPALEPVTEARFPAPAAEDLGDAQAAGLLRTALRVGFRSSAGPFRSLASIAVEPRPYQLVPLLMAMRQPVVRMAICDDVGIGKTIESGLIAAELLAQGDAAGLAVLCSPALAEQWQDELRGKFGIDAELVLASTVPRLERGLAYGQSLFDRCRHLVISTDFIKSPGHRDDFVAHCPDLVIVDEAHTCVSAEGTGVRSAQQRYELLSRLAADRRRHLLLVTATPHSGKDELFRSLIGLLDGALAHVDLATGTLSPSQRIERIEKLADAAAENGARRVLVATDCLSEGVNLQHHFNAVVHYDLAWNPTRHEQREGRVDRFGQRSADIRVVTIYGSDNDIDGRVLDVLIRKHREIRKSTGISVPVPDETSAAVTDAVVGWLLRRDRAAGSQQALFDLGEVTGQQALDLEAEWNSMAERERRSRSRYAQGSIHPDDVAREVTATRAALGSDDEIRSFTRTALRALGGDLTGAADGDFTVTTATLPAGLRDSIAAVAGERPGIAFRTAPGVPRGEAALTRTDPIVGAVAHFVLSAALDKDMPARYRPARRCGVIRTSAVTRRTTVLLVRYRFQLILPGRNGDRPLVAEDARVLGFEGPPGSADWLPDETAAALLAARPDANTATEFAEAAIRRVLDGLPQVMPELARRGAGFADDLREAHRRVRRSADQAVRGITVTARGDADILGTYVYLPVSAEPGVDQ